LQPNKRISLHTDLPLQPPEGRRYVRSFLFSRRINAPFARVHLAARTLLIFSLSLIQLRAIDTNHPDLAGAVLWWCVSLVLLLLSGISRRVMQFYFLVSLPALLSLFMSWLLFNPVEGGTLLLRFPLYGGHIGLGIALWQIIWLAIIGAYFLWTRKLALGLLIATVGTILLTRLFALPSWTWSEVPFFHPLTILISDRGLLVACTKVIGYSSMVMATIVLVVTSRDVELIGTMRQLHIPQPVIFFLSTVFRSLDLALSDFDTIRQAQRVRAIDARPRSFLRRLRDLGNLALPLIAVMIRRSSEIGDALTARGYTLTRTGTDFYETSPWRLIDWGILALTLVILFLALWHYPDITNLLVGRI
jgi:energy-coupling factor transporter transmembrane protein EcfT